MTEFACLYNRAFVFFLLLLLLLFFCYTKVTKTRRKYHFLCLVLHTLTLSIISLMPGFHVKVTNIQVREKIMNKQVSLIDVPVAYKASVAGNYRTH